MSDMKLIMENWKRFSIEDQILSEGFLDALKLDAMALFSGGTIKATNTLGEFLDFFGKKSKKIKNLKGQALANYLELVKKEIQKEKDPSKVDLDDLPRQINNFKNFALENPDKTYEQILGDQNLKIKRIPDNKEQFRQNTSLSKFANAIYKYTATALGIAANIVGPDEFSGAKLAENKEE